MRFYFETLGCKVNQYETQALESILLSRGHTLSRPGDGCDAVIVNTCAVTAESGRKSRQAVRHLKKLEPDAAVAVCGCFSQVSPEEIADLGADLISGSGDRLLFIDALERLIGDKAAGCPTETGAAPAQLLDDAMKRKTFEELPAGSVSGRTRAMLKIQDGCQNFCTYCVIPYARGPVRSLPLEKVVAEAARLNREGYREIVVTGIEISSYGLDFKDGTTLLDAVRTVSTAAPNARLRLGSLEPRTITPQFAEALLQLPNICDHFHLSLQSGCDETLKRMKRRYTTGDFSNAVGLLREAFPKCGITADLIVGFPGESDEEFAKTLVFIRECAFSSMHIFPYSRRPGTLAAVMPGQVDKSVKQSRARRAAAVAGDMARLYAESLVGETLSVLFEREENGCAFGHAANYQEVSVDLTGIRNTLLPVRIKCAKERLLFGEIIKP
jgi:threonylcarbamoyladenosine tRNA methylthiotransferase MtaB